MSTPPLREHNPSAKGNGIAKDESREQRLEVDDLKWLMADARGRRFLWRLLDQTHVFRTSFTGDSRTFFNEGERNIGLKHLASVNEHCPEHYLSMLKEHRPK